MVDDDTPRGIYQNTDYMARDATQMTNIPAKYYKGVQEIYNEAAMNEESFLHKFGTNPANNKVVELSINESGGNFDDSQRGSSF